MNCPTLSQSVRDADKAALMRRSDLLLEWNNQRKQIHELRAALKELFTTNPGAWEKARAILDKYPEPTA